MMSRSVDTTRIPTSRNGARRPLRIALQYSAFTGLTCAKSSAIPIATDRRTTRPRDRTQRLGRLSCRLDVVDAVAVQRKCRGNDDEKHDQVGKETSGDH